ncbi:hypothetical protein V1478_004746 [Vespula squamosa]|uniref:Uncharacterized protein n=1 Tax=Vespula squamosa TaxID=30214 RepID=A0ABD2BH30_VESSQ
MQAQIFERDLQGASEKQRPPGTPRTIAKVFAGPSEKCFVGIFVKLGRRNEVGEHPELGKWRMEISRGRWIAREGATNGVERRETKERVDLEREKKRGPLYVNTAGNSSIDLPLEMELEIKESSMYSKDVGNNSIEPSRGISRVRMATEGTL